MMIYKFKLFLITATLTLTICSCNRTSKVEGNFVNYLEQVHLIAPEDALYILIPMNSCDGCRQIVYRNLLSTTHIKAVKIVLIGRVEEALTGHFLGRLALKNVEILYDENEKAVDYQLLEEDYPMVHIAFIDFENEQMVSKESLTSNMINGEVDLRSTIFKSYIK